MTEPQRPTPPATGTPGGTTGGSPPATVVERTTTVSGEVQDTVDPFDYAESIVRDLALHVGSRLRDFRADLAAMHTAVVALPETMKVNVLGQSVQDLRERVIGLTGMVTQLSRPSDEVIRLSHGVAELTQRLAGVESWIAATRQLGGGGGAGMPAIPVPMGGFVGMDQFDRVVDQVHQSMMKVVGAVREIQLDLRDLQTGGVPAAAAASTPSPAPAPTTPVAPAVAPRDDRAIQAAAQTASQAAAEVARLAAKLEALEQRLADIAARPPAASTAPVAAPVAPAATTAPTAASAGATAALLFAAWPRLSQLPGPETLRRAVERTISAVTGAVDEVVRLPASPRGPGLAAVGRGRSAKGETLVLVAVEDMCGRSWLSQAQGTELVSDQPPATRAATWRTVLAAAALAARQEPGTRIIPIVVYGNGFLDAAPEAADIQAYADALAIGDVGRRLISVAADDVSFTGMIDADGVAAALRA